MAAAFSSTWKTLQAQASVERLIHEIIGESQIISIRLPSDPQLSQLQQCRRVLLRLKWVFDSYRVVLLRPSATPTATIERTFLLRVILHIIHTSCSIQDFQEKNLDYPLFRRIALETLLAAVSVYLLSQPPLSFDEDDLLRSRIEDLLEEWQKTQELSELECALQGIIVSVLTAQQEGDFEGNMHSQMRFENDMIYPKLQMTSSDPSIREHIHKSTIDLLTAIRVDDYTAPFMKAYTAMTEVNGLLFQVLQPEVLRKTVLENSLLILGSISDARQMVQPAEEFWNISTVLLDTLLSGISIMHNVPKEEKLFGNELATRLKRVMKAEAKDFNLFCSRRLDPIPTTQSYLRCSQSLQADRIPEYEYDTTYSRPTSSMSSTPTCAYEGPQTPSRSRSPMNMNEIVSSTIGREGSPAPLEMTSLVARNSYRVKRKTLPSPRSPPRSIPGTSHFGTEPQEPGKLRRSRVGSIDATYTPSLDPLAGIYPGHTNALIHDALDEGLKPSPLQVRTYSNAGSLASSVTSHSHSEIVPAYGGDARFDSLAGNNLGPSLLPDSKIADPNGLISPMSPISSSNVGSESAENLRPSALLTGQRVHAPSPVQASKIPNSPTSPISPPSYSETDLQNQTNAAPQVPAAHPSESSAPPITVADAIGVPPSSQTPSNGDDCTLELVHHLPSSERRDSERRDLEAQYPTRESITPNQLPRQPLGVPNTSLKDIESGLELATTFNPPRAPRTHSYGHPERPIEPDAISLRPSIRSSNSKGKSKFGFLKRFGGSKNLSVEEVVPSLPDSLQFCFSVCSQSLVLWSKKDSDFIVQIKHPFKTGRKIDLGNSRESNLDISGQRKGFSIRFVVASSQIVAAYACVNKENRLYIVSLEGKQHSVLLGEGVPLALAIAISPDGRFVAVGCGSSVLIHRVQNSELQKDYQVGTQIDSSSGSIRLQKLNFSTDSKKLVCATQVASRSTDRQTVHVKVWERSEAEWRNGASVEPVPLTMGYGGDLGLTSVFYSDRTEIQSPQVFLAASVSKAYPSILSTDITFRSRHLNVPDKRITITSQCLSSSSENLFAIQSGHHKISLVDIHTAITKELADFTKERRNIQLNHEAMAVGIVKENEVYAFWRSVDDKLVLKQVGNGVVESEDLTVLYIQIRGS